MGHCHPYTYNGVQVVFPENGAEIYAAIAATRTKEVALCSLKGGATEGRMASHHSIKPSFVGMCLQRGVLQWSREEGT